MTPDADARHRAVRLITPAPLLAVPSRHIERVAAAPGAEGVDQTLDGRGPAAGVLERQARVSVRARAQRGAAEAHDDRTTSTGRIIDRQRDDRRSRRTGTTGHGQRSHHGTYAPAARNTSLVVALQSNARVCSDLRLVALRWTLCSSRSCPASGGR